MADIRIKDMPAESSPADGDQFEIDSTAAGGRRVSLATLKTVIPAAIQPASATVRGGMKLTDSPADPIVYSTAAADARFTPKPAPITDLPSYSQYSGPSSTHAVVVAGDWIRLAKWAVGTGFGLFSVTVAEIAGYSQYHAVVSFSQGLPELNLQAGTRGFNTIPGQGIAAFRLIRKIIGGGTFEVYLEAQAGTAGIAANSLRVLARSLLDGGGAGTTRAEVVLLAAEPLDANVTAQGTLTIRTSATAVLDFAVFGVAGSSGGGNFYSVSIDALGRLHLNDARGAGLQAGAGNVLDVFAAAKLWARGGTDGRTVTPSTPALPRLVRGTVTPAASVAFTHNLNTTDPAAVQVSLAASPFTVARPDSLSFAANAVTLTWAAPPSGLHNIVIIG